MNKRYIWLSAAVLSLFWCGAASATTYINADTGKTSFNLSEKGNNPGGFYYTKVGDREFSGHLKIRRSEGAAGSYYYKGTFQDRAIGPGRKIVCSGDISIVRYQVARSEWGADVTWKVKGGENCPAVGQTIKMNLIEPLPRANASRDYNSNNANTWLTETAGLATWPLWRITSRDGELNCRQTPNGAIKQVYRANRDTISAELRGTNAIRIYQGKPWLLTTKGCYVRANSQYIQPISLPE
jgi:hypothetical protein